MAMLDSQDLHTRPASAWSHSHVDLSEAVANATHAVRRSLVILLQMASPRGRCNRRAFLHIALAFLAVQTGVAALLWLFDLEVTRTASLLMNTPVLWIGTTICVKRLHDVGRRGWWLPGAFVMWIVAALFVTTVISMLLPPEAMDAGQPAYFAVLIGITIPAFAALIWLHTAPSAPASNAFGPPPSGFGLSLPDSCKSSVTRRARHEQIYYVNGVMA